MVTAVFIAECSVVPSPTEYEVGAIQKGSRPNIFINGRYAMCGVEPIASKRIGPGETGAVRVSAMFDNRDRDSIKVGTRFEFRRGPVVPWANCRIERVITVNEENVSGDGKG